MAADTKATRGLLKLLRKRANVRGHMSLITQLILCLVQHLNHVVPNKSGNVCSFWHLEKSAPKGTKASLLPKIAAQKATVR